MASRSFLEKRWCADGGKFGKGLVAHTVTNQAMEPLRRGVVIRISVFVCFCPHSSSVTHTDSLCFFSSTDTSSSLKPLVPSLVLHTLVQLQQKSKS
jgi:hypothetical protein